MVSKKIDLFFTAFNSIWEKGSIESLSKWYHPDYKGIYLEKEIDFNDAENRLRYMRFHYHDIRSRILSISESGENKYLVLTNALALYGEQKKLTKILTSTLYELKEERILKTWTVTDKPLKFGLTLYETEDLTIEAAQKKKLLSEISEYFKKQMSDIKISPKEFDSLYFYLLGNPLKVIGAHLNVKASTIETHLRRVVNKFGLNTKSGLKKLFKIIE